LEQIAQEEPIQTQERRFAKFAIQIVRLAPIVQQTAQVVVQLPVNITFTHQAIHAYFLQIVQLRHTLKVLILRVAHAM
jgi:hypothetical protein